jgi:hypothetical protein
MALNSVIAIKLPYEATWPHQAGNTTGETTSRRPYVLDADAVNLLQLDPTDQESKGIEPSTALRPPIASGQFFEVLYQHLGRWTGRYGSQEAQQAVVRGWSERGAHGAFWLVQRVARERNLDALDGISKALEAMSAVAAPHIIAALDAATTVPADAETATKLFRMLEWFPANDIGALAPSLAAIVERSACHLDVELREAAYRCIHLLPNGEKVRAHALSIEADPELRDLLQEQNR